MPAGLSNDNYNYNGYNINGLDRNGVHWSMKGDPLRFFNGHTSEKKT